MGGAAERPQTVCSLTAPVTDFALKSLNQDLNVGSGSEGSRGGASAAAKTSELGLDDEKPTTKLETARREATLNSDRGGICMFRGDPPSRYSGLQ